MSSGLPRGGHVLTKHVCAFEEGNASMRALLGGRGAGLAEMPRLDLPVPPGFTITTRACNASTRTGRFPPGMWKQVEEGLSAVEAKGGRKFGDPANPLLVSVRSGAKLSMPGMMDTVLNLGLTDATVEALATSANGRFAWDAYRRLIAMFGRIVKDIDGHRFETVLERHKENAAATKDTDLGAPELKAVVAEFKDLYRREVGEDFPQDPMQQLRESVAAVFRSWNGKRAVDYRTFNKIPHHLGTAANVQMMVFGNMGPDSGTGVAFTRNQVTGAKELYGEYLPNAQGEDVVAGIRTPLKIAELHDDQPELYTTLLRVAGLLENHFREAQDIEFTVERGKLWMLQTRAAKPPARATVRIALDLVRVETSPDDVHGVLHSKGVLTARGGATSHAAVVTRGLGIPCVAGCEEIQVDYDAAEFWVGDKVVRRGESLSIDGSTGEVFAGAIRTIEPDFDREVELQNLLAWADEVRSLQVWANADYPRDAARARKFGAQGIGLDRTEHMFMETDRLPIVHEMILAAPEYRKVKRQREALAGQLDTASGDRRRDLEGRLAELDSRLEDLSRRYLGSLERIGQMQRDDFVGILREMAGLPVIIRLIDPPLHEFLPRYETLLVQVTKLRIAREDPEAFVRAATSEEDRTLIAEVRKAG